MGVLKPMDVMEALKAVEDPDTGRDIVTSGYVQDVSIRAGHVSFALRLAMPAGPARDALVESARRAVAALGDVGQVDVDLVVPSSERPGASEGILSGVKNVVAVASGKGGVGKSTVSANIALALQAGGARVGLLDADMPPSMPTMFAIDAPLRATPDNKIIPLQSHGIHLMSIGFMAGEGLPVIWRGPMVSNMVQQMLAQVAWPELDYLIIDLPPGTGDTQLTLCQQAPLNGAIIVTTPQQISLIDAHRGLEMFRKLNIPVIGIVENMSGFHHGGEVIHIFREGGGERIAKELNLPFLGAVPLDPAVCVAADEGEPIVARDPASPSSAAFVGIARAAAAQLEDVNREQGSGDLRLTW